MKQMWILWVCAGSFLCAQENCHEQVYAIDQQIQELTAKKELYQADAAQREDEGNRWQFEADEEMDAREAFEKATDDRMKIHELEMEINQLRQKKANLLQDCPSS